MGLITSGKRGRERGRWWSGEGKALLCRGRGGGGGGGVVGTSVAVMSIIPIIVSGKGQNNIQEIFRRGSVRLAREVSQKSQVTSRARPRAGLLWMCGTVWWSPATLWHTEYWHWPPGACTLDGH